MAKAKHLHPDNRDDSCFRMPLWIVHSRLHHLCTSSDLTAWHGAKQAAVVQGKRAYG